jgi:hypothetical protein
MTGSFSTDSRVECGSFDAVRRSAVSSLAKLRQAELWVTVTLLDALLALVNAQA